jgi:hypothetical protein
MTNDDFGLNQLPSLAPDATRSSRVVRKCHAKMARRHRPPAPARRLEYAVGGFCALYLLAIVSYALEVSLGIG